MWSKNGTENSAHMNRKLIVITGGTKGIGKAIIESFAAEGSFDIATCSRNAGELTRLKEAIEGMYEETRVFVQQADLSQKAECDVFADFVEALGSEVEVLVNNAGLFIPGAVHEEPEGSLETMIHTNLYSAYYLTRRFIGGMKTRKRGHVFNLCSTASIIPYVNGGSYCIAKFALYGMSKVLRQEMMPHNVKVTAILPGATLTASWEGTDLPPTRFMKAEDVASAVMNAYKMSPQSVVEEILIRPQLGDI